MRYIRSISVALSMVFLLTGCNDSLSDADFEKQASEILASAKLETAYEGHDFLSLLHAARQAFLKCQLSNLTFWCGLKRGSPL